MIAALEFDLLIGLGAISAQNERAAQASDGRIYDVVIARPNQPLAEFQEEFNYTCADYKG
jgi:hypothetical protein